MRYRAPAIIHIAMSDGENGIERAVWEAISDGAIPDDMELRWRPGPGIEYYWPETYNALSRGLCMVRAIKDELLPRGAMRLYVRGRGMEDEDGN